MSCYQNLPLLQRSKSLRDPFNLNKLNKINKEFDLISQKVNICFDNLNKKISYESDLTIKNFETELNSNRHLFLPPKEVINIYPEKLYIRNHMYCVKIKVFDLDTNTFLDVINLEELSKKVDGAYYSKKKTPSMVLFAKDVFCCAILTKKGNINLVGGYTEEEIKYTLIKFLGLIEMGFKACSININLTIDSLELHNMAISTSIPLSKIDIYNLTTSLESNKISFRYMPEIHDILTIKPSPISRPSIYIRIFPSGGIFSFGFKTKTEINIIMSFIASLIKNFIRIDKHNFKNIEDWRKNNNQNWLNQEKNKENRRIKKIQDWNILKNNTIE